MVATGWPGLRPAVVTIALLGLLSTLEARAQDLPAPPPPKPPVPGTEAPAATGDESDRTVRADGGGESDPQPPRPKPAPDAEPDDIANTAAGAEPDGEDATQEQQPTAEMPAIPPPKPGAEPEMEFPDPAAAITDRAEGADAPPETVSTESAGEASTDNLVTEPDRRPDDGSRPPTDAAVTDTPSGPPGSDTEDKSESEPPAPAPDAIAGIDASPDTEGTADPSTEPEDERPVRRRIPDAPLPRPTRNRPEPKVEVPVLARLSSGNVLFDRADANGDLRLSWNEMAADRRRRFVEFDRNDDARVSFEEYSDQPMPLGLRQISDRLMVLRARRFARYDADGDGLVSEQEYIAAGQSLFELMDEDNDGLLTPEEYDMAWRPAAGVVD